MCLVRQAHHERESPFLPRQSQDDYLSFETFNRLLGDSRRTFLLSPEEGRPGNPI